MLDQQEVKKEYTNGEITVVWQPAKCIHASFCWKELPEVFNQQKRPWIDMNGASSERIRKQVERCPSGALTYYENADRDKGKEEKGKDAFGIEVLHGGPLLVNGDIKIKLADGTVVRKIEGAAFCRCGQSKTPPFCDGTHVKVGFNK